MNGRMRQLRFDNRGNATIEFAFISLFFFSVMMVTLDFGMYLHYRLRLGAAVEQGGMLAFNNRSNIDATQISNYVIAASRLTGTVSVDFKCNGSSSCTNTNRQCSCLAADGKSFTATSCGGNCSDGSTAGYYMNIAATYPYSAMVVPNQWLNGTTIAQSTMVRLQ